jgi:hypothetical protein
MRRVPGSVSADLLIGIGLPRDEVIGALVREIGLDRGEAACAWDYAAAKIDADFPNRIAARISVPVG